MTVRHAVLTFALAVGLGATASPGATLDVTPLGVAPASNDLTAIGTADWAYWNTSANPTSAPNNEKLGGTLIGNATPVGGGNLRGSTQKFASSQFAFSDGTSTPSHGGLNVTGVFSSELDDLGAGPQVLIDLPTTQMHRVTVWVAGYNADGRFEAALPGATPYTDTSYSHGTSKGSNATFIYELLVTPSTAGDDLTLRYLLDADNGNVAHTTINAVAVSVVPVPSSLALFAVPTMVMLRRRR